MTKNENLDKIKKYSDLYKKNRINFDEYIKVVTSSIVELNEKNKYLKNDKNYVN